MQSLIHPQKYMQSRLQFFSFPSCLFKPCPFTFPATVAMLKTCTIKSQKKIITNKRHTLTQYNMKAQLFSCRSATISDGLSISSDSGTPAILDHRCLPVVGDRVFHSTSVTSKLHMLYCLTQVLYWSSFVSQYRGRCHQNLLQRTIF